jgi:hypothetical protein
MSSSNKQNQNLFDSKSIFINEDLRKELLKLITSIELESISREFLQPVDLLGKIILNIRIQRLLRIRKTTNGPIYA